MLGEAGAPSDGGAQQVEPAGGGEATVGGTDVGGTGATTGNGGTGGQMLPPDGPIPPAIALHKLDLLLMVDNSRNMIEKQSLLSDAVQWLLTPGSGPKLSADDIHIGVVTSSLGSHGAPGANDVCVSPEDDDHAHLLGALRPGLKQRRQEWFLGVGPAGEIDINNVASWLGDMVMSAGEQGCGYEASLEAWYRFLIDPAPPASVVVEQGGSQAVAQGVDQVVLTERAAFLRPDSVLAIVMLSDENDCSIEDEGYGWLTSRVAPMYRSTSACANPNDPCCQSCAEQSANVGCPALETDSECLKGKTLASAADDLNLRCFDQKRRFGLSLLYPLSRYSDGLAHQTVFDRSGAVVGNPIFAGGKRHPSQVILTGIVGVPWQDLADKASLTGPGAHHLTATELTGHWDAILGDPDASPPKRPTDPFMIETPTDRAMLSSVNTNPFVPETIVASSSNNPQANKINGHETIDVRNDDLQTACIFAMQQPLVCDKAASDAGEGCLCFAADAPFNRAVCQPVGGGAAGTTQRYAQAYPGIRHLQLLRALGDTAVTASICPKVTSPAAVDFGYRPAMKALAARLESAFNP